MKRKDVKKIVALIVVLCVFAALAIGSSAGESSKKKDGINGCKNCGRSPVYAIGFCQDCYEDFIDFTYGK